MLALSIVALILVLLCITGALVVPVLWRRLPAQVRRALGGTALGSAAVVLALTVPASLVPDAVDDLAASDRASVRSALRRAPGCWRTSRVTMIRASTELPPRHGFLYSCSWTILGWPSTSGEASCADGNWTLPGFSEPRRTFEPCGHATGER